MNNLIEMFENGSAMTVEQQEAYLAHQQLNHHKQMFGVGFVGMCQDLKLIRDKRYYIALGYEDFGAYTEAEHGIKQRQAYKYIQVLETLGVELLHSSAKLGVTKLLELASLDKEERESVLEKHSIDELEEMSTAEVKRLTEENKKLCEQLSFFQDEKRKADKKSESISEEERQKIELEVAAMYKKEIAELKEKNKKEVDAERVKHTDTLKLLANEKIKAKSLQEKVSALEEKEEKNRVEISRVKELEDKYKKAEEERAEIEKKIKISENPELTRCKFLFESWQKAGVELMAQVKKLTDTDAIKVRSAINKAKENLVL